jgi:hypothetical protein
MWIAYALKYFLIGFIFNLIYDIVIYYMDREDLRFNILERFLFACMWPIYAIMLIHTFIKTIIYGPDNDE